MTTRGERLQATAESQVDELVKALSGASPEALRRPCPGRERLGDGSVGALAAHTVDNYLRIGAFVDGVARLRGGLLAALGRRPHGHGRHGMGGHGEAGRGETGDHHVEGRDHGDESRDHGQGSHDNGEQGRSHGQEGLYTANGASPQELVERLADARRRLAPIAALGDRRLDAVPPAGSFRFCDGQRTVEQVLGSLLKHQRHQVQALAGLLA